MKSILSIALVVVLIVTSLVLFVRYKEKQSHRDFTYGPYMCGEKSVNITQHMDNNWLEGASSNQTRIKYKDFIFTTNGEFCPEGVNPDACYMKELHPPPHALPNTLSTEAGARRPSIKEVDEFASCFESFSQDFYKTQMENLKTMGIHYNEGIDSIIVLPRK